MKPLFFIFLCFFTLDLTALLDLDEMEQSFILETHRIHIPGHPKAFNPAIVRFDNRILMCFRSRDPETNLANRVGFTWLDNDFKPVGEPQLLELNNDKVASEYIQDPRLIVVNNKLYMPYSDLKKNLDTKIKQRTMCLAEIKYDGVCFSIVHTDSLYDFYADKSRKFEKNWVPFDYQGILLLAYSISPHTVFYPVRGENRCVTISESLEYNSWEWGELRGGTPALLIDQDYLSFFHSSTTLTTIQSGNQPMPHYVMGAYLFDKQPPFAIKKISPYPIVGKDFYNGKSYQTWKPLQVIFPCGYIYDKKYIWVSYGRQDHEAWIVKLDKEELLKSLIPFTSHF